MSGTSLPRICIDIATIQSGSATAVDQDEKKQVATIRLRLGEKPGFCGLCVGAHVFFSRHGALGRKGLGEFSTS